MTGFLSGLGGKLAERWLTLLTLPGCLFVAVAFVGGKVGHAHALDRAQWAQVMTTLYEKAQTTRPGTLGAIAVGLLLLAALAGLAAQVMARLVRLVWFGVWPGGVLGRRMRDVEDRVSSYYHVDLESLWPRLWLVLSPQVRAELRIAVTAVNRATVIGAWGTGYLVLSFWWWPAAGGAAITLVTAWVLARERTIELAWLVETAVDIGLRPVARSLGISPSSAENPGALGDALSRVLRKEPPARPPRRWRAPTSPPRQNRRDPLPDPSEG